MLSLSSDFFVYYVRNKKLFFTAEIFFKSRRKALPIGCYFLKSIIKHSRFSQNFQMEILTAKGAAQHPVKTSEVKRVTAKNNTLLYKQALLMIVHWMPREDDDSASIGLNKKFM